MTSSAKSKRSYGRYANVAVVQINQHYTAAGLRPKMISERAKGILRIVWHSGRCHVGRTERGEYQQTLKRAEEMASRLNNARDVAEARTIITAGSA